MFNYLYFYNFKLLVLEIFLRKVAEIVEMCELKPLYLAFFRWQPWYKSEMAINISALAISLLIPQNRLLQSLFDSLEENSLTRRPR